LPDAGATSWAAAVDQGLPTQEVAMQILTSQESLVRIVNATYVQVLGRTADSAALTIHPATLAQTHRASDLVANLAASPEFINARGGLDFIVVLPGSTDNNNNNDNTSILGDLAALFGGGSTTTGGRRTNGRRGG
jgi:hypothetical protein